MAVPSNRFVRGRLRRWLFWAWVAVSAAVALYIGIAGPIAHYFSEGRSYVALAVPALMFFMLATGLGWLVLMVLAGPPRKAHDRLETKQGEPE